MISKPIQDITPEDLLSLIGKPETRDRDFKRLLDDDVKEFLKDVTGFANAEGGDMYIGIDEGKDDDGNTVATNISGIQGVDADQAIRQITDRIRDNVNPRLTGVLVQPVPLETGALVFVVRVPRSWNAPHVVEYKGHWRFYKRHTNSTNPMDISELRQAFLLSDSQMDRLLAFSDERSEAVLRMPVVRGRTATVVHLLPLSAASPLESVEFGGTNLDRRKLYPLSTIFGEGKGELECRLNYQGLKMSIPGHEQGHVQLFRSGAAEIADTSLVSPSDGRLFYIRRFEEQMIKIISRLLSVLADLNISSPVLVRLALFNAVGYRIEPTSNHPTLHLEALRLRRPHPFTEAKMILPTVLVPSEVLLTAKGLDFDTKEDAIEIYDRVSRILLPAFTLLWNAGGIRRSVYFNDNNIWTGLVESAPEFY